MAGAVVGGGAGGRRPAHTPGPALMDLLHQAHRFRRLPPAEASQKGFNNCLLLLSRQVDYAMVKKLPDDEFRPLLLSLLRDIERYLVDASTRPCTVVFLLSVKASFSAGWFPGAARDLVNKLLDKAMKSYRMSTAQVDLAASDDLTSLASPRVIPNQSFVNDIATEAFEKYLPRMRIIDKHATFYVEAGYHISMQPFFIQNNKPRMYHAFAFICRADYLRTAACLITPPQAGFLVNGKPIPRRSYLEQEKSPQGPTNITHLLRVGPNVLQILGNFSAPYIVVIASMAPVEFTSSIADLEVLSSSTPRTTGAGEDEDDDAVVGAETVSLLCPITLLRMKTPVRGEHCKHKQCFDLDNFLEINSRLPSWKCPVASCPRDLSMMELRLDAHMQQILEEIEAARQRATDARLSSVASQCTEVLLFPDGAWEVRIPGERGMPWQPLLQQGATNSRGRGAADLEESARLDGRQGQEAQVLASAQGAQGVGLGTDGGVGNAPGPSAGSQEPSQSLIRSDLEGERGSGAPVVDLTDDSDGGPYAPGAFQQIDLKPAASALRQSAAAHGQALHRGNGTLLNASTPSIAQNQNPPLRNSTLGAAPVANHSTAQTPPLRNSTPSGSTLASDSAARTLPVRSSVRSADPVAPNSSGYGTHAAQLSRDGTSGAHAPQQSIPRATSAPVDRTGRGEGARAQQPIPGVPSAPVDRAGRGQGARLPAVSRSGSLPSEPRMVAGLARPSASGTGQAQFRGSPVGISPRPTTAPPLGSQPRQEQQQRQVHERQLLQALLLQLQQQQERQQQQQQQHQQHQQGGSARGPASGSAQGGAPGQGGAQQRTSPEQQETLRDLLVQSLPLSDWTVHGERTPRVRPTPRTSPRPSYEPFSVVPSETDPEWHLRPWVLALSACARSPRGTPPPPPPAAQVPSEPPAAAGCTPTEVSPAPSPVPPASGGAGGPPPPHGTARPSGGRQAASDPGGGHDTGGPVAAGGAPPPLLLLATQPPSPSSSRPGPAVTATGERVADLGRDASRPQTGRDASGTHTERDAPGSNASEREGASGTAGTARLNRSTSGTAGIGITRSTSAPLGQSEVQSPVGSIPIVRTGSSPNPPSSPSMLPTRGIPGQATPGSSPQLRSSPLGQGRHTIGSSAGPRTATQTFIIDSASRFFSSLFPTGPPSPNPFILPPQAQTNLPPILPQSLNVPGSTQGAQQSNPGVSAVSPGLARPSGSPAAPTGAGRTGHSEETAPHSNVATPRASGSGPGAGASQAAAVPGAGAGAGAGAGFGAGARPGAGAGAGAGAGSTAGPGLVQAHSGSGAAGQVTQGVRFSMPASENIPLNLARGPGTSSTGRGTGTGTGAGAIAGSGARIGAGAGAGTAARIGAGTGAVRSPLGMDPLRALGFSLVSAALSGLNDVPDDDAGEHQRRRVKPRKEKP